jgi:integrase
MQRKEMRRQDGTLDRRQQEAPPNHFAPLSQDEEARLCTALPGPAHAVVTLILQTGVRFGELRAQAWRDIDLVARVLQVTRHKTGKRVVIPLNSTACALLGALPQAGPLLFPTLPGTLATVVRTAAQQAGLHGRIWHRLRMTYLARYRHRTTS